MKANEFIREHGLQYTKSILEQFPKHTHVTNDGRMFIDENTCCNHVKRQLGELVKMSELNRIVESHALVQSYKGCGKPREHALSTAKFTLNHFKLTRELEVEIYGNNDREVRLEQAILDVESCR